MTLPYPFQPGCKFELGSHEFTAVEIQTFARKYDPQLFHVDPVAAKNSVLGGLCASGWHTAAVYMRLQREQTERFAAEIRQRGEGELTFGPSPGFEDLRWIRPVYAGEVISFASEVLASRASRSRPGWQIVSIRAMSQNQDGKPVLRFDSTVFLHWKAA